jgi:RimJ/RimL family protein N-acetyltransferase
VGRRVRSQHLVEQEVALAAPPVPDLETERLLLRAPTSGDLDDWIAAIWGDAEVMRHMPKSTDALDVQAQEVLDFFLGLRQQHRVGAWAIARKTDGRFMGHAILAHREAFNEPELGYALGKEFWGSGYATETARAVVQYGFEQAEVPRMFGVVVPENEPSWRILKRLGFVYEKDVVHYNMPLAYYALERNSFIRPYSGQASSK